MKHTYYQVSWFDSHTNKKQELLYRKVRVKTLYSKGFNRWERYNPNIKSWEAKITPFEHHYPKAKIKQIKNQGYIDLLETYYD